MSCLRRCLAWGLLLAGLAHAQVPEPPPPPPVALPPLSPPPLPPPSPLVSPSPFFLVPSARLAPRQGVLARVQDPGGRNDVSAFGAPSAGVGRRAQGLDLGFPVSQLRLLFGVSDRLDVGVGYDTVFLLMHEPVLAARLLLAQGGGWSFGARLEAGYAFFGVKATRETTGARYLSGRRNVNVSPSLLLSWQGATPRALRLTLDAGYLLALDTEPFSSDPLAGVPPPVVPGHNFHVRVLLELPLSSSTALVTSAGFELHGRDLDLPLAPTATVGLVTGL